MTFHSLTRKGPPAFSNQVYSFECVKECAKCCFSNVITLLPREKDHLIYLAKKLGIRLSISIKYYYFQGIGIRRLYILICGPCPFLGEDLKCRIYRYRPLMCQAYPIRPEPEKIVLDIGCPWVQAIHKDFGRSDMIPLSGMAKEIEAARLFLAHIYTL